MDKKFSVIIGGDGIGKSATIDYAQKLEKDLDLIHWNSWSYVITQNSKYPHGEKDIGRGISSWSPEARANALMSLIQMTYTKGVLSSTKPFLLVDSFYYRFFAKEILYGKCAPNFFSDLENLPRPFNAIVFELNPQLAWQRKNGIVKRYEYYSEPTFEDFCHFQSCAYAQYIGQLIKQSIPILWLNPEDTIEINAKKIINQFRGG